jgi:hypothetical protein
MIEKVPSFRATNGEVFPTLEGAQKAEIRALLTPEMGEGPSDIILVAILRNSERLVDILTTSPASLPKARKVNGGTKRRKAKVEALAVHNEAKADALSA